MINCPACEVDPEITPTKQFSRHTQQVAIFSSALNSVIQNVNFENISLVCVVPGPEYY